MEGALIAAVFIILGLLLLGLGYWKFRDFRNAAAEFEPGDNEGLHPSWNLFAKVRALGGHLDIWMFLLAGLIAIVVGLTTLHR